jgi:Peptidase family M23
MLLLVAAVLALTSTAHARTWRWPAGGPVVERFALSKANPYAPGQHRGITIATRAGTAVRAPCAGRVSFAGRVGGNGLTVSVRCGAFVASLVRLRKVSVAEGARVRAGARVGDAGRTVQLGVRRGGYVDPLLLLPAPRPTSGPPPSMPAVRHASVPSSHAAPGEPPPARPLAVLTGLALLAIAVPSLALVGKRRRRARPRGAAATWPRGEARARR